MLKWLSGFVDFLKYDKDVSITTVMPRQWRERQDRIEQERWESNPSSVRDFDNEYRKQGRDPRSGEYK